MEDFRIELKEEYKTFVLKDNHLALERMRFRFESWAKVPYTIEEIYDFQDFTEVTIRKETINFPHKTSHKFLYSIILEAKEKTSKKKEKFVFKNIKAETSRDTVTTYVIEHQYFESFILELFERLKNYPDVKIYAYETAKTQLMKKLNGFFPPLYVGSAVMGGTFVLKLLTTLLKISLKFSIFYFLDSIIFNIGAIFMIFGMSGAYFLNQRIKSKSQIKESIPSQFFPSFEKDEKFLTN